MKAHIILLMLTIACTSLQAQMDSSRPNFFPRHKGDVWQYHSLYTGELIQTLYVDSLSIDSSSLDTHLFFHNVYRGSYTYSEARLDTTGNYYDYAGALWYKFNADSGQSWTVKYERADSTDTLVAQVCTIYHAYLFGFYTTVKAFRFEIHHPSPLPPFWIGTHHFADGFGLMRQDVEPSDVYVLTGAIIDTNHYGTIDDVKEKETLPRVFSLDQNYPNPFNGETIIQYKLSEAEFVQLRICDILGRSVATLVEENQYPGQYSVHFAPDNLQSGVYFYRLQAGRLTDTKKMLLVK